MGTADLKRYVTRLTALREACPLASRSETISWVLRPLLVELGWNHDAIRSVERSGRLESDLVCSVDTDPSTPALLVAAAATDQQLSADRVVSIGTTMENTGIDRALYSNGREFLFLAGAGDDRLRIPAEDLPSRREEVGLYAHDALRSHCADLDPGVRVSRRIATFRADLADSIATRIERDVGPAASPSDRLVADFLEAVGASTAESTDTDVSSAEASQATFESSPASDSATAPDRSGGGSSGADRGHRDDSPEGGRDDTAGSVPSSIPPDTDPTGEYVVRIFNERGSIGAVGHPTSAGAMAEAASYFFERGLSGVRIPWTTEDGTVVINEEPVEDAGVRWDAFERLSNGLYVNTEGSVADRASRVQALADRAGLRVMLSGDWSGSVR